ncbi:MAG: pteridine reductase [Lysobacterales bacterium]|jgi:pteridine reductase|nr:MAG: pteridine reductase [Xanthomonadales bacterium]
MDPVLPLAGRCVLVTGGAKRLGAAIGRRLHAAGADVVVHYHRSAGPAQALAAELEGVRPGSALAITADLRDVEQLPSLVEAALGRYRRLDVLVNNASTFYPTPVGTITAAQFDDLVGTNLRAPLFLSQAAAPALRRTSGLILNMVDVHALRPLREHPAYCAAKAGLAMLTRSLARELGPEIRVNGIAPGPVLWPERDLDPQLKREIVAKTALERVGSPEDIARTAYFFAAEAPYVTGQILAVDGGRSL